jgi:OmpA-OmpF porin, OOP family
MKKTLGLVALCAGLMIAPLSAWAAGDVAAPKAEDFIKALQAPKTIDGQGEKPKLRGLSLGTGDTAAPAAPVRRISFQVEFEFNSDKLTPKAADVLTELGHALNSSELGANKFRITGHTDAVGKPSFNKKLSLRRANAVRDYLVNKEGVTATRLEAAGRGSEQLLNPADPKSGVNRRVEIANIGG